MASVKGVEKKLKKEGEKSPMLRGTERGLRERGVLQIRHRIQEGAGKSGGTVWRQGKRRRKKPLVNDRPSEAVG